jgi:hypothetical protein
MVARCLPLACRQPAPDRVAMPEPAAEPLVSSVGPTDSILESRRGIAARWPATPGTGPMARIPWRPPAH